MWETIAFCDLAGKVYEIGENDICPACGEHVSDSRGHVVSNTNADLRYFWCIKKKNGYLSRFLKACKDTIGNHKKEVFLDL